MMRSLGSLLSVFLVLSFGMVDDAEARRLGGGGSFGGKSSYGSSVKRSTIAPVRSPAQQAATQQNVTARQGLAQRGGLMGMLGGLAIGGLLGALLFGGAFENFNLMDLVIFGGIAFLLLRLLRARANTARPSMATPQPYAPQPYAPPPTPMSDPMARESLGAGAAGAVQSGGIPAGFDTAAFLAGAKQAYTELQHAWDTRDLGALRALSTDSMFGELQERIRANPQDEPTELQHLLAELVDVVDTGNGREVVVLFDARLREGGNAAPQSVREIWHFVESRGLGARWLLDGIQQVED